MVYTLPHSIFNLLETAFNGDRKKAETFGEAIEKAIQAIEKKAEERIIDKKTESIAIVKEDLRDEMASKEFVRAEISRLEGKVEKIELLIKVLIGLTIFGVTLANPGFVEIIKSIF
jgi:hypothetical protein